MREELREWEQVSDEELAVLCARLDPVDEDAWEVFYARFHEFVQRQVRRTLKVPSHEFEDIVQEAFVKIFHALQSYDPAKSRLKTFMSSVVAHQAIDYIRHGKLRRSNTTSLDAEVSVLQIQSSQDPALLAAAAERIVQKLGDEARVGLMLDLLHGKDVKVICAERRLNESQVYSARTWLRNMLRNLSADFPKH